MGVRPSPLPSEYRKTSLSILSLFSPPQVVSSLSAFSVLDPPLLHITITKPVLITYAPRVILSLLWKPLRDMAHDFANSIASFEEYVFLFKFTLLTVVPRSWRPRPHTSFCRWSFSESFAASCDCEASHSAFSVSDFFSGTFPLFAPSSAFYESQLLSRAQPSLAPLSSFWNCRGVSFPIACFATSSDFPPFHGSGGYVLIFFLSFNPDL